MKSNGSYFSSTIGRKQLVGVTGIGLCLFVLSHVLGNFLIFVGPEAYNKYSHALISNPLIYVAEAGLVAIFFTHMFLALKLTLENKAARPNGYAATSSTDKKTSLVTKTMIHQGMIIFIFLVLHLITFKFGKVVNVTYDGIEMRDIFVLLVEVFQSPIYVVGYILSLIVLSLHLSHGLSSSLQTLGFNHPKYTPKVELIGKLYAAFVGIGFISQPIYIFFFYKG